MKMFQLRFLSAVVLLVAGASLAVARDIPLKATWDADYTAPGIFGDGDLAFNRNADYVNGDNGIQCYLGVGGKNVVLFTYQTGRKLYFDNSGSEESEVWADAGLPVAFPAEVNLYVQFKGGFQKMTPGDIVEANGAIQFRLGNDTYNLRYRKLAVIRETEWTWTITNVPRHLPSGSSVTPMIRADLSVIRHRRHDNVGAVGMPFRFRVTILP